MTTTRRTRRLALAAASVSMILGATGCAYLNPVQTHEFYRAAEGINTTLSTTDSEAVVEVRNMYLVVDESGRGELIGFLNNPTQESQTVTIDVKDGDGATIINQNVTLDAGEDLPIGPAEDFSLGQDNTSAVPGANAILTLSGSAFETTELTLLVEDTSLGYDGYEEN